jgi:hypothetical protein
MRQILGFPGNLSEKNVTILQSGYFLGLRFRVQRRGKNNVEKNIIIGYNSTMSDEFEQISQPEEKGSSQPLALPRKVEGTYTFFPNPRESGYIANTSVEELSAICANQSDMRARFIHELWRTGRFDEITELARAGTLPDVTSLGEREIPLQDAAEFLDDLIISSSMMIQMGDVDPEEGITFVGETLLLIRMGSHEIPDISKLEENDRKRLLKMTLAIGERIQDTVETVQLNQLITSIIQNLKSIQGDSNTS